jgi:CRP-like cAMP-binding protein
MPVPELAELMMSFDLFRDYTAFGTQQLIERGHVHELAAGHVLYSQGDPAQAVVLVLKGEVQHYFASGGREVGLGSAGPSHVLADVQVLSGMNHPASARALRDTVILAWSGAEFRRLVTADGLFAQRLFHQTAVSLARQAETLTASLAAINES